MSYNNYSEWIAARGLAWNRACDAYWLGCIRHVETKLNLSPEALDFKSEFDRLVNAGLPATKENRKAFFRLRAKLRRICDGMVMRNDRGSYYYLFSLSRTITFLLGKHYEVTSSDGWYIGECFDEYKQRDLHSDEKQFCLDWMDGAFVDYNKEFRGGWQKHQSRPTTDHFSLAVTK